MVLESYPESYQRTPVTYPSSLLTCCGDL